MSLPSSGSESDLIHLTDPKAMRAIAHPVRVALLWHLLEAENATATECATVVGASAALCSYHLRLLAGAGFIAEAGSVDGRERRWKLAMLGFDLAGDTPEQRAAALAVEEQLLRHDAEVLRQYRRGRDTYSKRWQKAAADRRSTLHLTATELNDLVRAFDELMEPFVDRERRGERPPTSQRVHLVFLGIPWRTSPAESPQPAD